MPIIKTKKLLLVILSLLLIALLLLAAINITIDPFGVFGDRFFDWYAFNITRNPQAAKVAYLKKHSGEFDSFIIGGTAASAYSPVRLEEYTGGCFYNMFYDGADMESNVLLIQHLLDNYDVKNIVLPLELEDGTAFDTPSGVLSPALGGSAFRFYTKYLFANPRIAASKLKSRINDGYLPQPFDLYSAETGMYDRTVRDVEFVGGTAQDYAATTSFAEPVFPPLPDTNALTENLAKIRDLCAENSVTLTVILTPQYSKRLEAYVNGELDSFRAALAEAVDYWDFSDTLLSSDARYFYDANNMRNALGDMVLARIYGDAIVWYPPDFGTFIKRGEVVTPENTTETTCTAEIPVLLYHHFAEAGAPSTVVSAGDFEEQMSALKNAGYTAVTPEQLIDFVDRGIDLPEKPILITIDDGYMSNYDVAYPILQSYSMKATIFAIGVSVGKDTYKDTGEPIIPHFGNAEMLEMTSSGVVSVQSHTFDMHQTEAFDNPCRDGVLRMEGESEAEYIDHFRNDIKRSRDEIEASTGEHVTALAFPGGKRDTLADVLLREEGIRLTFTTESGINIIVKGLPESLYRLRRFNVEGGVTGTELINMIEKK